MGSLGAMLVTGLSPAVFVVVTPDPTMVPKVFAPTASDTLCFSFSEESELADLLMLFVVVVFELPTLEVSLLLVLTLLLTLLSGLLLVAAWIFWFKDGCF